MTEQNFAAYIGDQECAYLGSGGIKDAQGRLHPVDAFRMDGQAGPADLLLGFRYIFNEANQQIGTSFIISYLYPPSKDLLISTFINDQECWYQLPADAEWPTAVMPLEDAINIKLNPLEGALNLPSVGIFPTASMVTPDFFVGYTKMAIHNLEGASPAHALEITPLSIDRMAVNVITVFKHDAISPADLNALRCRLYRLANPEEDLVRGQKVPLYTYVKFGRSFVTDSNGQKASVSIYANHSAPINSAQLNGGLAIARQNPENLPVQSYGIGGVVSVLPENEANGSVNTIYLREGYGMALTLKPEGGSKTGAAILAYWPIGSSKIEIQSYGQTGTVVTQPLDVGFVQALLYAVGAANPNLVTTSSVVKNKTGFATLTIPTTYSI